MLFQKKKAKEEHIGELFGIVSRAVSLAKNHNLSFAIVDITQYKKRYTQEDCQELFKRLDDLGFETQYDGQEQTYFTVVFELPLSKQIEAETMVVQ